MRKISHFMHRHSESGMTKYRKGPQWTAKEHNKDRKGSERTTKELLGA